MNGELLVEFEISDMGVDIEIVFEEVKPLQDIGLFDINAAENSIPAPFLIDGSLGGGEVVHWDEFFFKETFVLHKNAQFFVVREVDILANVYPSLGFFDVFKLCFLANGLESGGMILFQPLGALGGIF